MHIVKPHPMHGPQPLKLGICNANCSGGLTVSKAPERWRAEWDDIVALTLMAEAAGLDFILPAVKWTGPGGEADPMGRSYETLTHGAALGALTSRIAIFVTLQVAIIPPVFAAKALATIDHASHGRVGLNIVCGRTQEERDLLGATIDPERCHDQGYEWYRILTKLYEGGPAFDWDGAFYKLAGLRTDPLPLQRQRPVTMAAGGSPEADDFAAKAADVLLAGLTDMTQSAALVRGVKQRAAKYGREIAVCTMVHVVCRETQKEADDFYYYSAEEMADREALDYYKHQKGMESEDDVRYVDRPLVIRLTNATGKSYAGSYPGAYPLVGTPESIAEEMVRMHKAGFGGIGIGFVNHLDELPFFVDRVLPLLEQAGVRLPMADTSVG